MFPAIGSERPYRRTDIPVEVITNRREVFPNLAAALEVYPDLDLNQNGPRFTWAMKGWDFKTDPLMARFEDWPRNEVLSR